MLSIHPLTPKPLTPNLLPTRINHNGPINNTSRHWAPTTDEKGTQHVHFRGRHLHGTVLPLPDTHTGAVLRVTEKAAPQTPHTRHASADKDAHEDGDEEAAGEEVEEVKVAECVGVFDEIVVWGHGGEVDGERDLFVRGVREWVGFAEGMHCEDEEEEGDGGEGKDGEGR